MPQFEYLPSASLLHTQLCKVTELLSSDRLRNRPEVTQRVYGGAGAGAAALWESPPPPQPRPSFVPMERRILFAVIIESTLIRRVSIIRGWEERHPVEHLPTCQEVAPETEPSKVHETLNRVG